MNELQKVNAKIVKQQIGRLAGGIGTVVLGAVLIGKFVYQKGITDTQKAISNEFPEEYATITEKVVEAFENHD